MIRLFIVGVGTVVSIVINIFTIVNETTDDNPDGIEDKGHEWTKPINDYFREDLSRRDAILIANGLFIDFIAIVQGAILLI